MNPLFLGAYLNAEEANPQMSNGSSIRSRAATVRVNLARLAELGIKWGDFLEAVEGQITKVAGTVKTVGSSGFAVLSLDDEAPGTFLIACTFTASSDLWPSGSNSPAVFTVRLSDDLDIAGGGTLKADDVGGIAIPFRVVIGGM